MGAYGMLSALVLLTCAVATIWNTWRGVQMKNAREEAASWKSLNEACEARERMILARLSELEAQVTKVKNQYRELEQKYSTVMQLNVNLQTNIMAMQATMKEMNTQAGGSQALIQNMHEHQSRMDAFKLLLEEATGPGGQLERPTGSKKDE